MGRVIYYYDYYNRLKETESDDIHIKNNLDKLKDWNVQHWLNALNNGDTHFGKRMF